MDSPLGPALANIFVGFYEQKLFDQIDKPSVIFAMLTILVSFLCQSGIVNLFTPKTQPVTPSIKIHH